MAGRQCYHCKQWIPEGVPHDCWTTTEAALTADLSEDLQEAWERLRESADFEDLMLLRELDAAGRRRGAAVCTVAEALDYLRALDAEPG